MSERPRRIAYGSPEWEDWRATAMHQLARGASMTIEPVLVDIGDDVLDLVHLGVSTYDVDGLDPITVVGIPTEHAGE